MSEQLQRFGVEYNLTEHCNLRCAACDHAAPLFPEKLASLKQFEQDLRALAPVLHARELRIGGGEPLLHPQLPEFLEAARASGLGDVIVLYTNGQLLHSVPPRVWQLFDELFLSVYPEARTALSLEALEVITRDHGIKLRPQLIDSFCLTLINSRIDDPALVQQIYTSCKLANEWSCHPLYEGRYFKCAAAPFLEYRLSRAGIRVQNQTVDGVPVHDNPQLGPQLEEYLSNGKPLLACEYCLGTSGPVQPHRLLGVGERQRWCAEDHRQAIEATRRRLAAASRDPAS